MKFHAPIEQVPTKYGELQVRIESLGTGVWLPIECQDRVEVKNVWDYLMWHFPDLVIKRQGFWLWIRKGDWPDEQPNGHK